MHLYSELTPPTAVTHSLTLPFTSASAFNLVVAKSSLLQIFATKTVLTASEAPHDNSAAPTGPSHGAPVGQTSSNTAQQQSQYSTRLLLNDDDGGLEALGVAPPPGESGQPSLLLRGSGEARVHTTRLVLVTEVQLSGTLTGLARVARANRTASTNEAGSHDNDGPGDYLLLSFRDAKLSLVEWDAEHATISTVSIHYYEQLQAPVSSGQQQTISHDLPSARPAAGKTGGKRDSAAGSGPGHPPPWAAPLSDYPTELMADPGSRCAALRFGDANLAVIPFRRDEDEEDEDDEGDMIMTDGASDDGRIPDDEWDEELDGPRPEKAKTAAAGKGKHKTNGTGKHAAAGPGSGDGAGAGAEKTDDLPFLPSYVLRLPMLDPQLLHPVHLAFLHEYRQPTFGVLSSSQHVSRALGRRDHLSYMVFTLDPSRGRDPSAVTTILSVPGLPQDLFRVVALPPPMGGALLVGANELVHVDQAGNVNGVAVNPVGAAAATARARSTSSAAALADQADLCLRLENCAIEILASADGTAEELLLVLSDGRLAIIVFKVDGRTVTGLEVKMVPTEAGGDLVQGTVTCTSRLNRNAMFVGCDEADSVVLGWSRKHGGAVARRRSVVMADAGLDDLDADLDDEDDLDLDDDDLYGEAAAAVPGGGAGAGKKSSSSSGGGSGDVTFRVHDRLVSIAPINAITYGEVAFPPGSEAERNQGGAPTTSDLQLVCAVGRGRAGALALLDREINPRVIGRFDFPEARGFWTMCVRKPIAKGAVASGGDKGSADADAVAAAAAAAVGNNDYYDHSAQHDRLMIVSKVDLDGYETSNVYALTAAGFEALRGTEFEPAAGFTIEAGTLGRDRRVIQVLKAEVRCYDGDLRLAQIVPMLDEETGAEPRVLAASLADPYLLAIRDDASIFVARLDETTGELEEVELPRDATAALRSTKWLAGCLYADSTGVFEVDDGTGADKGHDSRIFMFLLSAAGALYVCFRPRPIPLIRLADVLPDLCSS